LSNIILNVRGLNVYYGFTRALKGINFYAREGEIVGIAGPNGSGKTTLLEAIAGILPIREGEIKLFGYRIDHMPPIRRRRLGLMLVPQEGNIFPMMSVRKNLEVSVQYDSREKRDELIQYVYNLFPVLNEKRRNNANSLSGGQQKMLAVGIGIAANARVILIDEPSIGLAPKLVTKLFDTLKKIRDDTGKTIVLSEQNIKILNIADRLFGLEV